jgi:cell division protein FtsN
MAKKQSGSHWVWIALLLILGSFAGFVFFLDTQIEEEEKSQPVETSQEKDDKPRIDFYSILPEVKLDFPVTEEQQEAIENPSINKTADEVIILQVGSFQSSSEADSLKAQLAFLGLEAKIQSAVVNDDTWYRVMLGPYKANSELSRTQNLLIENKIAYMRRNATP